MANPVVHYSLGSVLSPACGKHITGKRMSTWTDSWEDVTCTKCRADGRTDAATRRRELVHELEALTHTDRALAPRRGEVGYGERG